MQQQEAQAGMLEARTIEQLAMVVSFDRVATDESKAEIIAKIRGVCNGSDTNGVRPIVRKQELFALLGRSVNKATLARWAKKGWIARIPYPGTHRAQGYTRDSVERFIAGRTERSAQP